GPIGRSLNMPAGSPGAAAVADAPHRIDACPYLGDADVPVSRVEGKGGGRGVRSVQRGRFLVGPDIAQHLALIGAGLRPGHAEGDEPEICEKISSVLDHSSLSLFAIMASCV